MHQNSKSPNQKSYLFQELQLTGDLYQVAHDVKDDPVVDDLNDENKDDKYETNNKPLADEHEEPKRVPTVISIMKTDEDQNEVDENTKQDFISRRIEKKLESRRKEEKRRQLLIQIRDSF